MAAAAAAASAGEALLAPASSSTREAAPATLKTPFAGATVELAYTPTDDINEAHRRVRAAFRTHRTRSLGWRRAQIEGVKRLVEENTDAITRALQADLRRPECVRTSAGDRPANLAPAASAARSGRSEAAGRLGAGRGVASGEGLGVASPRAVS